MTEPRADLHVHTRASDGTYTPEEAARKADLVGLECLAIADHDAVAAIAPARAELSRLGSPCALLPAAELTAYGPTGQEIHILAYGFDEADPAVTGWLAAFRAGRETRAREIVERLRAHGMDIDFADVAAMARDGAYGRLHVARVIVNRGGAEHVADAFARWLVPGAPGYVAKRQVAPREVVAAVRGWGAVAVLAHPYYFDDFSGIEALVDEGLDGFECYHPKVDERLRKELKKYAKKNCLVVTGGSDSHGPGSGRPEVGHVTVPWHFVEHLQAVIASRRADAARHAAAPA